MGFVKERMNFEVTIKLPKKAKVSSKGQAVVPDSGVSNPTNGNMDNCVKKARFKPILSELSLTRLSNQWIRQSDRNRSKPSWDHVPSSAEVSSSDMNLPRQHDNKVGLQHAVRIGRSAKRPMHLASRGKNLGRSNLAILGNSTRRNYDLVNAC